MIDYMLEVQKEMDMLNASLKKFRELGINYAKAEQEYKMSLSKKVLELRAEGQPATLIQLIAYGDKEVAMKRLERDVARTIFEACKEAINVKKVNLRIMQENINKEYYEEK